MKTASKERLVAIASPLAALLAWQALADAGMLDTRYLPSPWRILLVAQQLALSGDLWLHTRASLYRLGVGFVLGAVPGILIGMLMGLNRYLRAALDPLIAATYPIPKIAVLPLLMLVFGIGDGSKIAVVAVSVLLLSAINTMTGVRGIERVYFDVAKNFRSPPWKLFTRVILPAALPTIFAGLRISLGVALVVLVGAEFVASRAGIGFLIWSSWETLAVEDMFVGIIVITMLGVATTQVLKECERYFLPWRH